MSVTNPINQTPFSREMRYGFAEYAKYVIADRALPDARDGLKPVHRRILWAMNDLKLFPGGDFVKCARIVGETTGKYHPHAGGVYESLVRLAQEWSLRYPLVHPQGNFGSIDGMGPAAMRYTEAKLTPLSMELMEAISPNVVQYKDNFDEKEKEPVVLPVKVPNLLLNGTYGIAVGISSNIPPHNIIELMEACIAIVDNPDISIVELMKYVQAPDFPTGGILIGQSGISDLYHKGKGSFRIRSRYHLETPDTHKVDTPMIVFTEIPYLLSKLSLIEALENLRIEGSIRGFKRVEDHSGSMDEMRIEVHIEQQYANESSMKTLLGQLFQNSNLEMAFHCRINAFVYGQPKTLNLKQALYIFLDFRETTVKNIAQEELLEVTARLHILEGLIKAADNIDEVINIIRNSDDRSAARDNLIQRFTLSQEQANAILNMTLGRLAKADINKYIDEQSEKELRRDHLWNIINDRQTLLNKLKEEFLEIIEKYKNKDRRKSSILEFDEILSSGERPILHERSLLVTTTRDQFMRTIDYSKFKTQGRGGRGVAGVVIDEDDDLLDMVVVSNLDDLLLITAKGIVHQIPAYELPEVRSRTSKGNKIIRYLPVEAPIIKVVNVGYDDFDEKKFLITVTKEGIIKRSALSEYTNIRKTGIIAAKLKDGDEVVDAFISDGNSIIFIATKKGQAAVFKESKVRAQGRATTGVIGMKVQHGDEVVSAFGVDQVQLKETSILTVTEKGYGKRTHLEEYRITNRGVKGIRNMKIVSKNGPVVTSMPVPIEAGDSNMSLINSDGTLIKVRINGIRNMGRSTQGVKVMRIKKGQRLLMASSVIDEGEEEEIIIDDEDLAEIAKEEKIVDPSQSAEDIEDDDIDPTKEIVQDKDTTKKSVKAIDPDEFEQYLRDTDN